MEKIQEGQPFTIFVECAGTPAQLEKAFRRIRKMLPRGSRLFGVFGRNDYKKELAEKLRRISERYCDQLYFAPSSTSDESRRIVFETAFRKADFGDFVLVLENRDAGAVREAARQVAYELDLY